MSTLLAITALLAAIWFWLDSLRAREIATGIGRAACERRGVQFLDYTVALQNLGLRWLPEGVRLRRVYRFDYSEEGAGRHTGHITMLGIQLRDLSMGLPEPPEDVA
jgi:hypothetical protein